jgi:putative membrane protein
MSDGIRVLLGILGGAFLLLAGLAVFSGGGLFGPGPMMGPGGMMDGGFWGAWGVLWMLVPLLFWGGLLAVIAWAVPRIFSGWHGGGEGSAEEVLRRRFAKGEIDAEEYEERLRVLGQSSRREVSG